MTEALPAETEKPRWRFDAKRAALLIGFVLSAVGLLGPQFYVTPVEDRATESAVVLKALSARIDDLRAWQSQYLMFEQIGALVLALDVTGAATPGSNQHHTLRNLEELSLVERSTPVIRMIGELALVKKRVQSEATDHYRALIGAARKETTQDNLRAVNDFETAIIAQVNERMAELQKIVADADAERNQLEVLAARRKLHLLLIMTFGSTLLLAANLLSEKS